MKEIKHQDHLDNMARQGTPARHTPGPWTIRAGVYDTNPETACEFPHGPEIFAANDEPIAWCQIHGEANARLIAATPDMLAELEWLYQKHGYASTRDVLAKAKGERTP